MSDPSSVIPPSAPSSSSTDPIGLLFKTLNDFKEETKLAVNNTITMISESAPAQKLGENEQVKNIASKVIGTIGSATQAVTGTNILEGLDPSSTNGANPGGSSALISSSDGSTSLWSSLCDWIARHKVLASAIALTTVGGSAYYLYRLNIGYIQGPRQLKFYKKRRMAKKISNGGRVEVVVIAGSPSEPLTRTIATDLARRGFIIYWTASSPEEEEIVLKEGSDDIRALTIQSEDVNSVRASIKALADVLNVPATAFPGAIPHMLSLAGVIVVPDLYYPAGPVESISVDSWADLLNSKILGPIFLLSNGLLDLVRSHHSRVVLVSPSIMGNLNPGFHAAESIVTSALSSLSLSLSRELEPQHIPFIHIKMGSFDVSHGGSSTASKNKQQERLVQNQVRRDILSWPDYLRAIYARQYQAMSTLQTEARSNGSPLRILNYTIYDALTDSSPSRVYYSGRGAFVYEFLPKFLPEFFISWMLYPKTPNAPLVLHKGWEPF